MANGPLSQEDINFLAGGGWIFTDAEGNTKRGVTGKSHRSDRPKAKNFNFDRGSPGPGQVKNIFDMSMAARAAGVGKSGWNPKNFSRFQSIINNNPGLGMRSDIDYQILLRTKDFTPWEIELFLKQMERNAITVGIHKTDIQRKVRTPSWNYRKWYGQLPYWASDYVRGDVNQTIVQEVEEQLNYIFGEGSKPSDSYRKYEETDYFDPYGKDEENEFTRSEWRATIPRNAIFIKSSEDYAWWALYNPRIKPEGKDNAALGAMLEYGNPATKSAPRPWLRPSVEDNMDLIRGMFADCLKHTFRDVLEIGQFGPWIQVGGRNARFAQDPSGQKLWMGWDTRDPMPPAGTMDKEVPIGKQKKQSRKFENLFREMLQNFKPLLEYLENNAQDYLEKTDEPADFTKDYKAAGGANEQGYSLSGYHRADIKPGIFTGQLSQAIRARWESGPRILQE